MKKEEIGIKDADDKTATISNVGMFTKHMDEVAKRNEEEKVYTSELRIADCQLPPLHLACLDDEMRPNFRLIEIKNGIATATNGTIIVKIDLSLNGNLTPDQVNVLNGKYIHMEVWKEIQKCDVLEVDDEHIIANKNGINKIFEYSNPNGAFFKIENVILDVKEAGEEPKRIMAYNPKFIGIVEKIFKHEQMCFSFSKGDMGTFVFPYSGSGMFALIMPMECTENRYFFV